MRYRKLDANGDYSFGSGLNDFYIDVPEAVGQAVKTTILLWRGEFFLNVDAGIPEMQAILGKHPQEMADAVLKDAVLAIQGVTGIPDYQSVLNPDSRVSSVNFTVNTIYGPTNVQIQNYGNY